VRYPVRVALIAVALIALVAGTGCVHRSPPVSFFTLNPEVLVSDATVQLNGEPVAVFVGPADFPKALRRSLLATRSGANEIEFDQFNRWAGSLDSDFLSATGANLSALLGSNRIAIYPNNPVFPIDYQVSFEVQRFDTDTSGVVTLHARWTLQARDGVQDVYVGQFSQTQAATAANPSAAVAAHSALVAALSRDIAAQIKLAAANR